mmetsp:Transcript_28860/g.92146  ORF Transcript_28860/g.92146 Transcript_28860/m.92146 type:complete len:704 (-) Transcript_28860:230-2341(-)
MPTLVSAQDEVWADLHAADELYNNPYCGRELIVVHLALVESIQEYRLEPRVLESEGQPRDAVIPVGRLRIVNPGRRRRESMDNIHIVPEACRVAEGSLALLVAERATDAVSGCPAHLQHPLEENRVGLNRRQVEGRGAGDTTDAAEVGADLVSAPVGQQDVQEPLVLCDDGIDEEDFRDRDFELDHPVQDLGGQVVAMAHSYEFEEPADILAVIAATLAVHGVHVANVLDECAHGLRAVTRAHVSYEAAELLADDRGDDGERVEVARHSGEVRLRLQLRHLAPADRADEEKPRRDQCLARDRDHRLSRAGVNGSFGDELHDPAGVHTLGEAHHPVRWASVMELRPEDRGFHADVQHALARLQVGAVHVRVRIDILVGEHSILVSVLLAMLLDLGRPEEDVYGRITPGVLEAEGHAVDEPSHGPLGARHRGDNAVQKRYRHILVQPPLRGPLRHVDSGMDAALPNVNTSRSHVGGEGTEEAVAEVVDFRWGEIAHVHVHKLYGKAVDMPRTGPCGVGLRRLGNRSFFQASAHLHHLPQLGIVLNLAGRPLLRVEACVEVGPHQHRQDPRNERQEQEGRGRQHVRDQRIPKNGVHARVRKRDDEEERCLNRKVESPHKHAGSDAKVHVGGNHRADQKLMNMGGTQPALHVRPEVHPLPEELCGVAEGDVEEAPKEKDREEVKASGWVEQLLHGRQVHGRRLQGTL